MTENYDWLRICMGSELWPQHIMFKRGEDFYVCTEKSET